MKAWHYHKKQTDNFTCIKGMMKVALYDDRPGSSTLGARNEFFIGDKNPLLNYNEPDEFRLPPDTDKIPYDWLLTTGKRHV